jgi:glycerophosphoryl diester phosphodiesterase
MMRTKLYGHRGARGEKPENTLEGFLHAQALGLAGVETDMALTADLVPVLHHNPALEDGRLIKHMKFADLPAEIPSLAQALHAVPGIEWLLEIKTFPDQPEQSYPPSLMVQQMLAVLGEVPGIALRVLAFDWAVLRALAAQAPWVRRVCLTAPKMAEAREIWWGPGFAGLSVPQAVAAANAHGWAAFQGTLSPAEAEQAQTLGLEVFAWTVNEAEDFYRLAPLVDGIVTDHPARLLPWMVEPGHDPAPDTSRNGS